jgi:hypothetical protein
MPLACARSAITRQATQLHLKVAEIKNLGWIRLIILPGRPTQLDSLNLPFLVRPQAAIIILNCPTYLSTWLTCVG